MGRLPKGSQQDGLQAENRSVAFTHMQKFLRVVMGAWVGAAGTVSERATRGRAAGEKDRGHV
jgi:hypothetical protein